MKKTFDKPLDGQKQPANGKNDTAYIYRIPGMPRKNREFPLNLWMTWRNKQCPARCDKPPALVVRGPCFIVGNFIICYNESERRRQ